MPALAPAHRARAERVAQAGLAGLATAVVLNALPFYPTGIPLLLAAILGALAVVRPLPATALVLALAIPLAGNIAAGLVPLVVVAAIAWSAAIAAEPRAGFAPALAPPLAALFCAPLYLLAAGRATRGHVRFAVGAAGAGAVTLACGLAGLASPLTGAVPGVGLAGRLAGAESVPLVADQLLQAATSGVIAQALVWGVAAVAARPAYRLEGPALRVFAVGWTLATTVGTVLAPVVVGGHPAPSTPALVGAGAAAILLALRSLGRHQVTDDAA